MAGELAHALSLPNDPRTRLKGRLGPRKEVAWAEPLPLDEVKSVGKAFGWSTRGCRPRSFRIAQNHTARELALTLVELGREPDAWPGRAASGSGRGRVVSRP